MDTANPATNPPAPENPDQSLLTTQFICRQTRKKYIEKPSLPHKHHQICKVPAALWCSYVMMMRYGPFPKILLSFWNLTKVVFDTVSDVVEIKVQ